ncbi:MAG TPA: TIGR00153 family protein [Methanomicrobia archaeon]|nr:TIGR00153 family protein [Methanomicrobia archaeon]
MTTNPLAKIFIRSPFEPIIKHAEITKEAIEKLNAAFNLFFERDYPKMETLCKEVIDLETDADNIKAKIREKLPSGILMPVSRGDILDLIDHQDKIADQAENLAQWLLIKETDSIPLKMVEFMKRIMDLNVKIAEAYLNAVKEFKDVIETIFMKKEINDVMKYIEIVENLEGEIDRIQFTLRNSFFDFKEIDPVSLYYTTKIIDIISDISDKAEASVHRLRILIAEK